MTDDAMLGAFRRQVILRAQELGNVSRACREFGISRTTNTIIFYGKDSELTGADREHQEVSMLALHLLQSALVHVNTLERLWSRESVGLRENCLRRFLYETACRAEEALSLGSR